MFQKGTNMKIKELTDHLERIAPLAFQEPYDNAGLLVGNPNQDVRQVLICLDCTEEVVEEAIRKQCDMIISHHPIVFKGLKKFTGKNYVERVLIKAIRHNIALYAIHTNLDNVFGGVSSKIADKLGLQNHMVLSPKRNLLKKLAVYVPRTHVEIVRNALFEAGAGSIGKYEECSYNTVGYGTFRALEGANPSIGKSGTQERVEETKIEVIYPDHKERSVLVAMYEAHPYEEVAHDIFLLDVPFAEVGSGAIGNLPSPMSEIDFLALVKDRLNLQVIRHTKFRNKPISRVALCGGSGSFLLPDAKRSGADIFITADYKYHEFFDAEDDLIIADIGHFESEQFTQELLLEIIQKNLLTLLSY